MKIVLNITPGTQPLPPSPSESQLQEFNPTPEQSIWENTEIFGMQTSSTESFERNNCIPGKFKELCQAHLAQLGIKPPTYIWTTTTITPWDQVVTSTIVKHWLFAREQAAFSEYPLNPDHCNKTSLVAMVERWTRGQKLIHGKPTRNRRGYSSRIKKKLNLFSTNM